MQIETAILYIHKAVPYLSYSKNHACTLMVLHGHYEIYYTTKKIDMDLLIELSPAELTLCHK